jgi:hypothetical protein
MEIVIAIIKKAVVLSSLLAIEAPRWRKFCINKERGNINIFDG